MSEAYRGLWTNSQGVIPTDMWATYLLKIGEKRATNAMVEFLKSGSTFPPTLSEFIEISKPKPLCHRIFKALPKPDANPDIVKSELESMKAALRGVSNELREMRESLERANHEQKN